MAAAQTATANIIKQIVTGKAVCGLSASVPDALCRVLYTHHCAIPSPGTASGRPIELEGEHDTHAVAGVLKKLLRQLPEPLLTFELWDKFVVVITGTRLLFFLALHVPRQPVDACVVCACACCRPGEYNSDAERIIALRGVVHQLPPCNFTLTKCMVELCAEVTSNSVFNRMSPSSLGT
jgi:hypothetical protein